MYIQSYMVISYKTEAEGFHKAIDRALKTALKTQYTRVYGGQDLDSNHYFVVSIIDMYTK